LEAQIKKFKLTDNARTEFILVFYRYAMNIYVSIEGSGFYSP